MAEFDDLAMEGCGGIECVGESGEVAEEGSEGGSVGGYVFLEHRAVEGEEFWGRRGLRGGAEEVVP